MALGSRRLAVSEINAAWGRGGGRGALTIAGPDEDTLTLAWLACDRALAAAGVAPADVGALCWGTTRLPFAEGPSWTHLAAALRLGPTTDGSTASGSNHAGIEALVAARDAVAAGRVDVAVVVTSDAVVPGLGSGVESAAGAGASAWVLRCGDGPATLGAITTRWMPVLDRYRGDREDATREAYDGRLFREEIFLPILTDLAKDTGLIGEATNWSLPDPDGRLGAAAAKRLGADATDAAATRRTHGDLGAAAAMTGASGALGAARTAAMVAYGGGRATAVRIDVTAPVPGADDAAAILADDAGSPMAYAEVLRSRGQLRAVGEQVEMAVPPGSAMFVRNNSEILGLHGARCTRCATISSPPSIHPACISCGGDSFEPVLLERSGVVQTFVINHTMPAPFVAPLPLICADLSDGSRVMLQGVGDGSDVAIGERCELVLRRYTVERGVPIYGWKIQMAASPASPPAPTALQGDRP